MSRRSRVPGTRKLLVLPSIDDDLDEATKNALAIRNACAVEGRCPSCGAVGIVHPDAKHPGISHWVFQHEPECEALVDDAGVA